MKNRPAYGIASVDHALRLAVLLQQEGPLRVADAAERLGVARSTAHRLLAMLVYRDFAVQRPDRSYAAGPVFTHPTTAEPAGELRRLALPELHDLVGRTGETASLQVLAGNQVRFVATVEGTHVLRVGDREGRLLPAHLASGGRAILATRSPAEVAELLADNDIDLGALRRDLIRTRLRGYGLNQQETESGVSALGAAVLDAAGRAVGALCLAAPTARFTAGRVEEWAPLLKAAVNRLAAQLRDGGGDSR
ncbi:DNA-binding IclR family transcriptional regulator [Crossiella equi]|uniref:DNA-binding IclR family transcriptional regulator n=1 Tax=Crossiella equi TaxID=130796 RepID=A0ABS5A4Q7_9PSEU|nr:IclR family transcriptional regulator [Crossiella equi]MBP2471219.1 DNA-binding IclR family transcriptional regulator [Crossiella equi]